MVWSVTACVTIGKYRQCSRPPACRANRVCCRFGRFGGLFFPSSAASVLRVVSSSSPKPQYYYTIVRLWQRNNIILVGVRITVLLYHTLISCAAERACVRIGRNNIIIAYAVNIGIERITWYERAENAGTAHLSRHAIEMMILQYCTRRRGHGEKYCAGEPRRRRWAGKSARFREPSGRRARTLPVIVVQQQQQRQCSRPLLFVEIITSPLL